MHTEISIKYQNSSFAVRKKKECGMKMKNIIHGDGIRKIYIPLSKSSSNYLEHNSKIL